MLTPVARRKFSQRRGGRSVLIQRGGQVGGQRPAAFAMEAAMRGSDRVGMRVLEDGRRVRYFKSNGEVIDA